MSFDFDILSLIIKHLNIYLYYSKTNLEPKMNGEGYNRDPLIMPVETYPFQIGEFHNQQDMPIGYKSLQTQINKN